MRRSVLLIACLWAGWSASPASAILLYGVSYDGGIYEIDQITGTRQLIITGAEVATMTGDTNVKWLDAADGLTPTTFLATAENGSLYEIDVSSETVVKKGSYGPGIVIKTLAYVEEPGPGWTAGLYGVEYTNSYAKLYTIDVTSGAATPVGPNSGLIQGAGGPFVGVYSMDYDPVADQLYITNQLFAASNLHSLNPSTAQVTLPPVPIQDATPINDMWYDHDTGRMLAMGYGEAQLFELNTATGQLTKIGTPLIGSEKCLDIMGLGNPIPEPAAGLLLLLGAALLGRRRR